MCDAMSNDLIWTFCTTLVSSSVVLLMQRHYRKKDLVIEENSKSQIQRDREIFLQRSKVITESQFMVYNELWVNLCDLENIVNDLWENNLPKKISELNRITKKTEDRIRKSAILLETQQYLEILEIVETLRDFRIGKIKLGDAVDENDFTTLEIQRLIEKNFHMKKRYEKLKF